MSTLIMLLLPPPPPPLEPPPLMIPPPDILAPGCAHVHPTRESTHTTTTQLSIPLNVNRFSFVVGVVAVLSSCVAAVSCCCLMLLSYGAMALLRVAAAAVSHRISWSPCRRHNCAVRHTQEGAPHTMEWNPGGCIPDPGPPYPRLWPCICTHRQAR